MTATMHHFTVTFPATPSYTRSYTLIRDADALALRTWLEAQDIKFELWHEHTTPFTDVVLDISAQLTDCQPA